MGLFIVPALPCRRCTNPRIPTRSVAFFFLIVTFLDGSAFDGSGFDVSVFDGSAFDGSDVFWSALSKVDTDDPTEIS